MTTVLKHIQNEKEYLLLHVSSPPDSFFEITKVCVCDRSGQIEWLNADDVKVISHEGQSPGEYLYKKDKD
jgi:hypothetical protein